MKAAVVVALGRSPVYTEFPDPTATTGETTIRVHAAALSNLVKSRASGTHYSSEGALPFVVGVDGVGQRADGRRAYFVLPRAPYGSMSESTVVRSAQVIDVPDDLDDVTAAAIANPGMSSWAALKERARFRAGETVLVNGSTGTAGRLAVQIAKHLGARRVIATGRNAEALAEVSRLGADATIPLGTDPDVFEQSVGGQFRDGGVDIVLDYLWGWSAERIIAAGAKAGNDAVPIRFIQIGALSAPSITLPSPALRSSAIELLGSGIGSIAVDRLIASISEVLRATVPAGLKIDTRVVPLADVEQLWPTAGGQPRIVVRIA
jgi:NADPH:quinone reductase-like Zn-dependent oxidoreductase